MAGRTANEGKGKMMKRGGFSSAVGSALASSMIYLCSLAAPALAMDLDEADGDASQATSSVTVSGPEREEQRLWPATHYPVVQTMTRPQHAKLAQTSGPARDEYRLWPVVDYPLVQNAFLASR